MIPTPFLEIIILLILIWIFTRLYPLIILIFLCVILATESYIDSEVKYAIFFAILALYAGFRIWHWEELDT